MSRTRRPQRYGHHVAWALLGLLGAAGMFWAASWLGVIAIAVAIAGAFVMWSRLGSRGSWFALIMLGIGIAIPTTVMAITGAGRCPKPGATVILKEGKPPVDCAQIKAGAMSMAVMFWLVALIGVAAPFYASRVMRDDADGESSSDGDDDARAHSR